MSDDKALFGLLAEMEQTAMKAHCVSITTLSLSLALLGSAAQASVPSEVQVAGGHDQLTARSIGLGAPFESKQADISKTTGNTQIAWCYWYRDQNNRPCS